MLSGLPIGYGDPVRAFLVTEHPRATLAEERCDFSSKWLPRTFPVRGTYDDGGGIENVADDVFKRLWVEGLQKDLIELSEGENPCHDIPVTRNMDWKDLWKVIKEERLIVSGFGNLGRARVFDKTYTRPEDVPAEWNVRNVRVAVAMVREDVWQSVMSTWIRHWNRESSKLRDVQTEIRAYWAYCKDLLSSAKDLSSWPREEWAKAQVESLDKESVRSLIRGTSSFSSRRLEHPVSQNITDELVTGWGTQWLRALEGAVCEEELEEFFAGVSEAVWFEMVNGYRGVLWQPSVAGGQEHEWLRWLKYHRNMVQIVSGLMLKDEEDDEPIGPRVVPTPSERLTPNSVLEELQDLLTLTKFRDAGLSKEDAQRAQALVREEAEALQSFAAGVEDNLASRGTQLRTSESSSFPIVYVVLSDDNQYKYSSGDLKTAKLYMSLNDISSLKTNSQERICEYVHSSQLEAMQTDRATAKAQKPCPICEDDE